MAELSCDMMNCTYNKDRYCCKGDIMVGGKHAEEKDKTSCESFLERKNDSFTSAIEHPSLMISIDCEAVKCMYNTNYRCTAKHVDIKRNVTGSGKESLCGTFQEK